MCKKQRAVRLPLKGQADRPTVFAYPTPTPGWLLCTKGVIWQLFPSFFLFLLHTHIYKQTNTPSQIRSKEEKKLSYLILLYLRSSSSLSPISSYLTSCLFNPLTILFLYRLLLCLHLLWGQLYNKALPQCAVPCAWRLRPAKTLKIWTQWTSSLPHRSQSLKIPATASTAIHTPAPCLYPSSIACSS